MSCCGNSTSSATNNCGARVIAKLDLDDVGTSWSGQTVSLRWVLIHMIEETCRHAGHMDILRELIDGATGDHNRG
ncbi:MAG: DUF664 domain-containing protein [Pseudonocardiaceae bacterium]